MPRKKEGLKRHNIMLREGDYDRIRSIYGNQTAGIIRRLVTNFVNKHCTPETENPDE
jgi:hypothetical protein